MIELKTLRCKKCQSILPSPIQSITKCKCGQVYFINFQNKPIMYSIDVDKLEFTETPTTVVQEAIEKYNREREKRLFGGDDCEDNA